MKKTGSDLRLIANHPVFQFEEDFFHSLFSNFLPLIPIHFYQDQARLLDSVRPLSFPNAESTRIRHFRLHVPMLRSSPVRRQKLRTWHIFADRALHFSKVRGEHRPKTSASMIVCQCLSNLLLLWNTLVKHFRSLNVLHEKTYVFNSHFDHPTSFYSNCPAFSKITFWMFHVKH